MKKRVRGKKGIDTYVATVLLVGFVIIILILAFLWGRNYILSRAAKSEALGEKQYECASVKIAIPEAKKGGNTALIKIENAGSVQVDKFLFRSGEDVPVENYIALAPGELKSYEAGFTSLGSEMQVIPWLKVASNQFVPCSNKALTIALQ